MSPDRSVRPYDDRWLPMFVGGLLVSALLFGVAILDVIESQLMQTTGHTLALAAGAVADELDRIGAAGRCTDDGASVHRPRVGRGEGGEGGTFYFSLPKQECCVERAAFATQHVELNTEEGRMPWLKRETVSDTEHFLYRELDHA